MTDPFDEYARRILAWDYERQKAFEAVVEGDDAAAIEADNAAWWAQTRVTEYELDLAQQFLLMFRLAVKCYPTETMAILDELNRVSAEFWEKTQEARWCGWGSWCPADDEVGT